MGIVRQKTIVPSILHSDGGTPIAAVQSDVVRLAVDAAIGGESGFPSASAGGRFYVTGAPATPLVVQASYVSTTPTLMLRNGATRRIIFRSLNITLESAPANPVGIYVATDTTDRFSAGGTARTPSNSNTARVIVSAITAWLENATAVAAGATERPLINDQIFDTQASAILIDFQDGVIIGPSDSFLLYVFDSAGAVAPSIGYVGDWSEIPA